VNRHLWQSLATVAAVAAMAGCAYQEHYRIPTLDSPSARPSAPYPYYGSYSPGYYGYGNWYYGPRSYGYADPFDYYPDHWFGSYPYAYGYRPPYVVVPCGDSNRDGRCDRRVDRDGPGDQRGRKPIDDRDAGKRPPPAARVAPAPRERAEQPGRADQNRAPRHREPTRTVER
jgi:hypothetical protein